MENKLLLLLLLFLYFCGLPSVAYVPAVVGIPAVSSTRAVLGTRKNKQLPQSPFSGR
jgi:hypothetical protein